MGLLHVRGTLAELERSTREISMVERLERHQRKQDACGKGSAHRPFDVGSRRSVSAAMSRMRCAGDDACQSRKALSVHGPHRPWASGGAPDAQLDVFFCSACAERHGWEMKRVGRTSGTETSVSRAIEYLLNPRTDSTLGSPDPAWHGFRFPSAEYAAKFRELNAGLIWTRRSTREGDPGSIQPHCRLCLQPDSQPRCVAVVRGRAAGTRPHVARDGGWSVRYALVNRATCRAVSQKARGRKFKLRHHPQPIDLAA